MFKRFVLVASVLSIVACSSVGTPPSSPASNVTVQNDIPWTFPMIKVNRVSCPGVYADCLQKVGELCAPRGAMAQQVDDHDAIYMCRPKSVAVAAPEDE